MQQASNTRFTLVSFVLLTLGAGVAHANAPDPATLSKIAKLSVPFVPNAGQWNVRAAFAAHSFAGTLFVTTDGQIVYSLPGKPLAHDVDGADGAVGADATAPRRGPPRPAARGPGWVLSETLVDAQGRQRNMSQGTPGSLTAPAGFRPMEGKVSYGIGNDPSKHADNLNTYEQVNLGDMYPGINVQLRATGNNVEKIFTVAPKHDPKLIHLKLAGADKLEIGAQGELIAHTGNGPVAFTAPIAFQETANGERTPVQVAYALDAKQQRYSFTVGHYDASLPLVIDPLLQSTYLGGTGTDIAFALAIHPASGEVYIAGNTGSTDLPSVTVASGGISTGAQSVKSTGVDAFVSRLSLELAAGDWVPNAFAFAPKLNVPLSNLHTSDPAQITGVVGNVPVSIVGGNFAEFCVSSTAGCSCNVQPFSATPSTINDSQYVCVRQVAPAFTPGQVKATLVVGGGWADFIVSTGTQITSCNLDIDGSGGAPNAASDGLMLVRAMLGFTGAAVTNGAIIGTPPRNTWALIQPYLNSNCGTSFLP